MPNAQAQAQEAEKKKKEEEHANKLSAAIEEQIRIKNENENLRREQIQHDYNDKDQVSNKGWDDVVKSGKDLYSGPQNGYDSWISAMSSLMSFLQKETEHLIETGPTRDDKLINKLNDLGHYIGKGVYDRVPAFIKGHQNRTNKPGFDFKVEFDSQNRMSVTHLKRDDGQPITNDVKDAITQGVLCQMMQKGYTASKDRPWVMQDKNGDDLTQEKYLELTKNSSPIQYIAKLVQQGKTVIQTEPEDVQPLARP